MALQADRGTCHHRQAGATGHRAAHAPPWHGRGRLWRPRGSVIVVDHAGRLEVSGWGGILSLAARTKGIEGVIVDGACRDVDESRDLGFPVYARAAVPITARGRIVEKSFNETITIGGITVQPGDLVMADSSASCSSRPIEPKEVLAQAEAIVERESQMAAAVRAGQSVVEVMGASYNGCSG